jgi:glycosyltransferase involved in cell wall biosynthesis
VAITLPDLFIGGGQRIVLNYLAHRDVGTFDVRIVTLHPQPDDLADEFRAVGVPVSCLDVDPGGRLTATRRLTTLLRDEHIDLVHTQSPEDQRPALPAALVARVPMLFHLHSEWNHRGTHLPEGPSRLRAALGTATGVLRDRLEDLVVREYLADSAPVAAACAPHVRRPVHAMTQSMPLDEMAAAAAAHDDRAWREELGLGSGPVAINVSRLAEGKGQDRLIRAMATVRRQLPDAQLVLVGDGEQRGACEALAAELDLTDAVRFLGTRRDVPRLLVGADAFAFGSATESFGLVVAEAMAARLPVVAFELPSIATFSVDARSAAPRPTGYYVAQDDDEAFAAALTRVLGDRTLAARLGAAGRDEVARRFPPDATARSFEAAYRRIPDLPPAPAEPPHADVSRPDLPPPPVAADAAGKG